MVLSFLCFKNAIPPPLAFRNGIVGSNMILLYQAA